MKLNSWQPALRARVIASPINTKPGRYWACFRHATMQVIGSAFTVSGYIETATLARIHFGNQGYQSGLLDLFGTGHGNRLGVASVAAVS